MSAFDTEILADGHTRAWWSAYGQIAHDLFPGKDTGEGLPGFPPLSAAERAVCEDLTNQEVDV